MLGTNHYAQRLLWSLALVLGAPPLAPAVRAASPGSAHLAEAREALSGGRPTAAIRTLEATLGRAPDSAADRAATLALLRDAYEVAAQQAERTGDHHAAESLRENARILAHRAGTARQTPPAAAPAVAPTPTQPAAAAPTAAPTPEPTAAIEPEPVAAPAPTPAIEPAPQPIAASPALPAVDLDPSPATAATPAPAAAPSVTTRGTAGSASPARVPIQPGLTEADAAFRAKRYAEAGAIYAQFAAGDQLPAERREHWAYCRSTEVARRINAGPRTEAEWQALDAEIEQIRALAPENWLGDYLRNKALARPSARRVARTGGGLVVRGASPEEGPARPTPAIPTVAAPVPTTAPALSPAAGPAPALSPAAGDSAGPATEPAAPASNGPATTVPSSAGRPAVAPIGRWQTRESANFRVFHHNPKLAEQVVQIAENTRRVQIQRWTGKPPAVPWQPKCEIYLFPTAPQYAQMTGQPLDSPGFSTMGMNQGTVIARRVSLRTDHEGLLNAVLPHEVTHVILADFFPDQQIPRWADEGIAVLTEPTPEQDRRAADLVEPLHQNVLFEVEKLVAMDYPDNAYWALYYAQSVSLTRFLVEQGTPQQFIQFLQGAQKRGFDAELRRVYKIDGAGDLQNRWVAYARAHAGITGRAPATATASTNPRRGTRVR